MAGVGALLDEHAVVAGDLLGDVAQQREVDGADAALQLTAQGSGCARAGLNWQHGGMQQASLAIVL